MELITLNCFEIFATKFERCVYGPVNPQLEKTFGEQNWLLTQL